MRDLQGFYQNKIYNENVESLGGFADPFILRYEGSYYLYVTASHGVKCFCSKDLYAFLPIENKKNKENYCLYDESFNSFYAPEVIYYDGYFYLISSPDGNGHYVFKASSPVGPFNRITENIHESIDGSFFIDTNEEIYLSRASETGICSAKFKNDFKGIKGDNILNNKIYFKGARTSNWTEGPYILKRYNKYYLTYCGTHFLSDAYRIRYSIGNDLNKEDSFKDQGILAISTNDEFYGIGHSMNFLAPNLDSYLICYHNMINKNTGLRGLNISRLLFSNSLMTINDFSRDLHPKFEHPLLEKDNIFVNYPFKLIDNFDFNSFTVEYYFIGNNKVYINYIDDKNYLLVEVDNELNIYLKEIKENKELVINTIKLNKRYNNKVKHSIRLQYFQNRFAVYFDNIEKDIFSYDIKMNRSSLYVEGTFTYFALSKYAFGNSDNEEIKLNKVFSLNYDLSNSKYNRKSDNSNELFLKKNDYLSYFIYKEEEGEYYFDIYLNRVYRENQLNIIVNDKIYSFELNKNDCSSLVNLGLIKLKEGINKIEIINSYGFSFTYFETPKAKVVKRKELNLDLNKLYQEEFEYFKEPIITKDGYYYENDRNIILSKDEYENFKVSIDIETIGQAIDINNNAGLNVLVSNYSKSNEFEKIFSFCGIFFGFNKNFIYIIEANFDKNKILYRIKNNVNKHKLSILKYKNNIEFFVDNQSLYQKHLKKMLRGKVGLYMNHESCLFKKISLSEE